MRGSRGCSTRCWQCSGRTLRSSRAGLESALFTTPTGMSLFEADCLTRHHLCRGNVSVVALVAFHRGALPHFAVALDGLDVAGVRALL